MLWVEKSNRVVFLADGENEYGILCCVGWVLGLNHIGGGQLDTLASWQDSGGSSPPKKKRRSAEGRPVMDLDKSETVLETNGVAQTSLSNGKVSVSPMGGQ